MAGMLAGRQVVLGVTAFRTCDRGVLTKYLYFPACQFD